MPPVQFDKFYRYDELTAILQAWAGEQPDRLKLASIGKSFEGRDIWLATVTNFTTGPDADKPALMISAADDWFFPRGMTLVPGGVLKACDILEEKYAQQKKPGRRATES